MIKQQKNYHKRKPQRVEECIKCGDEFVAKTTAKYCMDCRADYMRRRSS